MLSRLIKYEIKATGRIFLPLFLSFLVFAGISKLITTVNPQKWHTPANISVAISISIMVGISVMTFVVMIQRFYKNLLSDEGYLMHTLPVKPWNHIISKLLVSMLWMIVSVLVVMIAIADKKGTLTQILKGLAIFHNRVIEQYGALAYLLAFEIILGVLICLALGILSVYTSIAVGHLFGRHKMLVSFCTFFVLSTLTQIYYMLVRLIPKIAHFSLHISSDDFINYQALFIYGLIFSGLQCIAYFASTNFILSKRLNLE